MIHFMMFEGLHAGDHTARLLELRDVISRGIRRGSEIPNPEPSMAWEEVAVLSKTNTLKLIGSQPGREL